MKNPVQQMLKAGSQMKNNPQLAKQEENSPDKVKAFAAQMVIPRQQAMQNSKPIPYPVGSVLMQKLAQAQQAALAAQQPNPREGGIAQMAAKGGVLKFAKGKKIKNPLPEDLIATDENSIQNLGEQLEQGRRQARITQNQKAELGLVDEPVEQKTLTSQERGVKTALQEQNTRMNKNATAVDRAVRKAQGKATVAQKPGDPLANPNATTKRKTTAARTSGAKDFERATTKTEASKPTVLSPEDASYEKRMTALKRKGESYQTPARDRIQRPAQHTTGAPIPREDLEVKRVGARPTGIERSLGSGLQNPAERGKGIAGGAPSYEGLRSTGRGTVNKPVGPKPVSGQKPSEQELKTRKEAKYAADKAAEESGAEPKKVSKEAEAYRKERLGSEARVAESTQKGTTFAEEGIGRRAAVGDSVKRGSTKPMTGPMTAKSPASFMDNLTGSVKNFFSKNPDMMANARQVAQDVLSKNPEATMDEIGAAIKKAASPEAIKAIEAEIAPTLEKHGVRDFFNKAAGGISGAASGAGGKAMGLARSVPGMAGYAMMAYPVAAGAKEYLDENFDLQRKVTKATKPFMQGLEKFGESIIPGAEAAGEPGGDEAELQRYERMAQGKVPVSDLAGPPPAQAPATAPAPTTPQSGIAASPQAPAAPAAPAAQQGGIAASPQAPAAPQAPAPKRDLYAGDTSEGTPQGAISELMGLQGPGYQYSPEVMGMLKDAKDEERGNTLLKMIGMTGAGLANRDRYAGAHDAALLATQAFTSGTEREDAAQKQFLQGIIHNEQVPFEQRAKAYNDYIGMEKAKATNEALMARANLTGMYGLGKADIAAQSRTALQRDQYATVAAGLLKSKLAALRKSLDSGMLGDAEAAAAQSEYDSTLSQMEAMMSGMAEQSPVLTGLAGGAGLGQTTTPRLTLDAFK